LIVKLGGDRDADRATERVAWGVIKSGSRDAETPENRMVISTYLLAFKAGFSGKMPLLITPGGMSRFALSLTNDSTRGV
jgi:hypothetical protein